MNKLFTQENGRYGEFGGVYMPELLMAPISELTAAWNKTKVDKAFRQSLTELLKNYAGRPTPLTEVTRFSASN